MSDEELEDAVKRLLKHGVIREAAPRLYKLTEAYLKNFSLQEECKRRKRSSDPLGLALTLTLAKMYYPDAFTKTDVNVLAVIHLKELGL